MDIHTEPITHDDLVDPGDLTAVSTKIMLTDDGNRDEWFFLKIENQGVSDDAIAQIELYHDRDKNGVANLPNDALVSSGIFTDGVSLLNLQGAEGGYIVGEAGRETISDFLLVITTRPGETRRGDQIVLFIGETAFFFRKATTVGPPKEQSTIKGPTVKGIESITITALNQGKPASFEEAVELAAIEIRTDIDQKWQSFTLQLTFPAARTSIDSLLLYKDSDPLQRLNETDGNAIGAQTTLDSAIITFSLDQDLVAPIGNQSVANNFLLIARVKPGSEAREGDLLGVTIRKDTAFNFSKSGIEGPNDDFIAQGPNVSSLPPEPSIGIFLPAQTPLPVFDDQYTIGYEATGPNLAATITFFYSTRSDFGENDVQSLRDRVATRDDTGITVPANTGLTPPAVVTVGSSARSFVWSLIDVPEDAYTIYGIIEDADVSSKLARSEGQIEVRHDVNINTLLPGSDTKIMDGSFLIKWQDQKNDSNARISLYYSADDLQTDVKAIEENAMLIVTDLNEDDDGNLGQYKWNFRDASAPEGVYFLYAIIRDTNLQSLKEKATKSSGALTISYPPTINLISPILQGSRAVNEFTISWFWQDLDNNDVRTNLFYHREQRIAESDIKTLIEGIGVFNSIDSGKIGTINTAEVGRSTFSWDIQGFDVDLAGSYYIYAEIEDGVNHSAYAVAPGTLTLRQIDLRIRPSTIVVGPGEEFTVAIQLRNPGVGLEGASVYLTFKDQFLQIQNSAQPFSQPSSLLGDDPQSIVFDLNDTLESAQEILENDTHGDTLENSSANGDTLENSSANSSANGISGFQLDYSIAVKENPALPSENYRTLARLTFTASDNITTRPINTTVSFDFDESENRNTSVVTVAPDGNTEKDITPIASVPALTVQIAPFAAISGKVLLESRQDHSQQVTFALRKPGNIEDLSVLNDNQSDEEPDLSGIQMTTKPDGSFTIKGIPTGVWELVAKTPGFLRGQYQSNPSNGSVLLSVVPGDKLQKIDILAQDGSGQLIAGDITDDNRINIEDFAALISAFGTREGSSLFNTNADINDDGRIDIFDFQLVNRNFGLLGIPPTGISTPPEPAAPSNGYNIARLTLPAIPEVVQANRDLEFNLAADAVDLKGYAFELEYDPRVMRLVGEKAQEGNLLKSHSNQPRTLFISKSYDTESGTRRILVAHMIVGNGRGVSGTGTLSAFHFVSVADGHSRFQLRNLTVMDGGFHLVKLSEEWSQSVDILQVPTHTELVQNYPNPFNPETWIPYRLSGASQVRIQIYSPIGRVIRILDLGRRDAGDYTHRTHAAYWDGRNDFGERVSSGIYFYELLTDHHSSVRKMVVVK